MIRLNCILISCALCFLLCGSRSVEAVEETVQNVHFEVQGKEVHVFYDLSGRGTYTVELRLSADGGRTFKSIPQDLTGDIGAKVHPGRNKRIVWDALKDVEQLEGESFVFEVIATRRAGSKKWALIGGAVAAGAAAAILVSVGAETGIGEKVGTIVIDVPDPQ